MPCHLDHITITAPSLAKGQAYLEDKLGITPQVGGEHPLMGTHNLLLRLGNDLFLEVIAAKPNTHAQRARWFGLDQLESTAPAKLRTWVARTHAMQTTLDKASEALGEVEQLSRGALNWLMGIPKDGSIGLQGMAPALIEWQSETHPATTMQDFGASLLKLELHTPEVQRVQRLLASLALTDNRIEILQADQPKLVAQIQTPQGICILD